MDDTRSPREGENGGSGAREVLSKVKTWTKQQGDTWTMLNSLMTVSAVAMAMGVLYGYLYSPKGALLAFLASLLGYAIGGISGFLFGFPRYTDAAVVQTVEDLRTAATSSDPKSASRRNSPIRHSTNLERITDWLMTMIVGATVINLKDLASWAETQFIGLTSAIIYSGEDVMPTDPTPISAPGALLVLPFMVAGFLHLYLWARRYLPREWREADDDLYARKVEELVEKQQVHEQEISDLKKALYTVDASILKRFQSTLLRFGADSAAVEDVITRYRNASAWQDDPIKNFGPPEADGFRMTAEVIESKDGDADSPYEVNISIERIDGQPFTAAIAMLYHNSFDTPIETEPYQGTKFTDAIWSKEGFTLGALIALTETNKTIRLAIDLDNLSNLPKGFRSGTNPE